MNTQKHQTLVTLLSPLDLPWGATNQADFSVVLFRSDFVLVSEKNRMKTLKNQWAWTMTYPPERLAGATGRGQTMAPEAQQPAQ